jgi:hypothetical protein
VSAAADTYADDSPSTPPLFDFDLIGDALADVLEQPMEGATVIGVHGPWGSGKTTLMYAIRDALMKQAGATQPIVIEFNAWKYQAREALWRALILRLVAELRNHGASSEKLKELEESLYRAFEVEEAGAWSVNWRTAATEVASVGLELLQLGVFGRVLRGIFGRRRRKDGEPLLGEDDVERIGGVLERKTVSRHLAQVQSIEQFLDAFRDLIAELNASSSRVVVLVDDLDRCLPEAALEIFEAIKLFLDAPGCGFVVAVDREVIRNGLAVRYGSAPGAAKSVADPDEYIEKTIAISYDVPRLSNDDVETLLATAGLTLAFNADHKAFIARGLNRNPRRVKRFLNLLRLQMDLAQRAQARGRSAPDPLCGKGDAVAIGILLKTMLVGYRYPFLLRSREDLKLLFDLQAAALSTQDGVAEGSEVAKSARNGKVPESPAAVAALKNNDEFWALMEQGANLSHQPRRAEVIANADWFRQSGVAEV